MSSSARWAAGLTLVVAAIALFATERLWLNSRSWEPVNMPVHFFDSKMRMPPFKVNLPDTFNINLSIDQEALFRQIQLRNPDCVNADQNKHSLSMRWQLLKDGRAVNSGEGGHGWLGNFVGKGTYAVELESLTKSQCWQFGSPELFVYCTGSYFAFHRKVMMCCWVLGIAGLFWILAPVAKGLAGNFATAEDVKVEPGLESKNVEARRRNRLPLRRQIAFLPDRGVVFGMPVMVMLIVMWVITQQRESRGTYVSLAAPSIAVPVMNTESALVVQVEVEDRARRKWEPKYRVQGSVVAASDLREALKRELARRSPWVVYIYGDDSVALTDVARVIDVVNGLGARPVLVGRSRPSRGG
jgi:biopolymer transport protein ExbD